MTSINQSNFENFLHVAMLPYLFSIDPVLSYAFNHSFCGWFWMTKLDDRVKQSSLFAISYFEVRDLAKNFLPWYKLYSYILKSYNWKFKNFTVLSSWNFKSWVTSGAGNAFNFFKKKFTKADGWIIVGIDILLN